MASDVVIQDALGNAQNILTFAIVINGTTYQGQACPIVDPISGAGASIGPAGTNGANALSIQGITNMIPLLVTPVSAGAMTSNITSVMVGEQSTTLLNANSARTGVILYNAGGANVFIAYGATASTNAYSFILAPGETQYIDTIPWRGQITAIVGAPTDGSAAGATVMITEISP